MAVQMKNTVLIRCSCCGMTERHTKPEHFMKCGWTVRNQIPLCPECAYEEFKAYFEFLKCCESERYKAFRKERRDML